MEYEATGDILALCKLVLIWAPFYLNSDRFGAGREV
jgi:hypothetical protein